VFALRNRKPRFRRTSPSRNRGWNRSRVLSRRPRRRRGAASGHGHGVPRTTVISPPQTSKRSGARR
jgi:hypothetical protein